MDHYLRWFPDGSFEVFRAVRGRVIIVPSWRNVRGDICYTPDRS